MKKIHFLINLLFTVFILILFSCSKSSSSISSVVTPSIATANFNYSNDTAFMCHVVFTNSSINATKYSWDFGDGKTSIEKNPIHIYQQDGNYDVTLSAFDSLNKSNIIKKNILVKSIKGKVVFYVGSYLQAAYNVKRFQFDKDTIWGKAIGGGAFTGFYLNNNRPDCNINVKDMAYVYVQYAGDYFYMGLGDSQKTNEINKLWTGKYSVNPGVCNKVNVAYK